MIKYSLTTIVFFSPLGLSEKRQCKGCDARNCTCSCRIQLKQSKRKLNDFRRCTKNTASMSMISIRSFLQITPL